MKLDVQIRRILTTIPLWVMLLVTEVHGQSYTNGVSAWWKLDEAASDVFWVDAIGNNQLSEFNTPGTATGKVGGCVSLAASSNEYLKRTRNSTLSPGTNSITACAWVNMASKGTSHYVLGINSSTGNQREFLLFYSLSSDRFRFSISTNGTSAGGASAAADVYGSPSINTWAFLVGWYDRSANTVNIQVNNGNTNSIACTGNVFTSTTDFYIGQGGDALNYWDGLIDEAVVWQRTLTAQERTDLYNGGVGVTVDARTPRVITSLNNSYPVLQQAVWDSAPGDTINVLASTNTYVQPLVIDRNIALIGPIDGTNTCIFRDGVLTNRLNTSLILATWNGTNGNPRISNIKISTDASVGANKTFKGVMHVSGNNHNFRIDHVKFNRAQGVNFYPDGYLWGVVDHCYFDTNGNQDSQIYALGWASGDWGNGSWSDDPYWGSEKYIFFENCVFTEVQPELGGLDLYGGGRATVRFNMFTNGIITTHGTEGYGRGGKQYELYGNSFVMTSPKAAGQIRSGSALMFSNTWVGFTQGLDQKAYRQFQASASWGKSDGTSVYDTNYDGGPFYTGVHTGVSAAQTLTDTNATFAANLHRGYILSNPRTGRHSYIISNTSTNIVYFLDIGEAGNLPFMLFDNGDAYSISRVYQSLDQPGMGKGEARSGWPFTPATWPNEVLEPSYTWDNVGITNTLVSSEGTMFANTNWFNLTPKPGYTNYTYPHPLIVLPTTPSGPTPTNGATNQLVNLTLSWSSGLASSYDIYFGTTNSPPLFISAWPNTTYSLSPLVSGTTYYWYVVATSVDGTTAGPVWSFTVGIPTPPVVFNSSGFNRRRL